MVALLTVNVVEPVTEPRVAVMVTVPGFNPDTWLIEPNLAIVGSEELQFTCPVRLLVLPLLKCPVAIKLTSVP